MKRTFRGTVNYERTGVKVLLFTKSTTVPAKVTYRNFRAILGIECRKSTAGTLDLKLRLIGNSLPWTEWEWSDVLSHSNRLIVEHHGDCGVYFDRFSNKSSPSKNLEGRDAVMDVCHDEFNAIFPGLLTAVGEDNACEVEITVEGYTND